MVILELWEALKGEAAVEMIWVRTPESIKKLQNKYYGPAVNSNIESDEVSDAPKVDETIRLTSNMTSQDIERQIAPIIQVSAKTGKVINKEAFKKKPH